MTRFTFVTLGRAVAALLAALVISGCNIDKQTAPSAIGPSEFGLSVTLSASPDQLPRDGSASSIVTGRRWSVIEF